MVLACIIMYCHIPVCVKDASKTTSWHMDSLSERNNNGKIIIMYNAAWVLDKLNFIKISSLVTSTGACTSKCLVNLERQQAGV